jgi:biopolymer transport protein ExbB/TolQ
VNVLAPLAAVNGVERIIFDVAEALRIPVLVLALASIAFVLVEVGALAAELVRRRGRGVLRVEEGIEAVRSALAAGDKPAAVAAARELGYNGRMSDALAAIVEQRDTEKAADRIAKRMAEYDYWSLKRLERTRILVRTGPAIGLMGTLIPLSPALEGLAQGNVEQLSNDLRVAFSVTVAGLVVGVIAFGVSLVRDRLYAQDFSDVEYVLATLEPA